MPFFSATATGYFCLCCSKFLRILFCILLAQQRLVKRLQVKVDVEEFTLGSSPPEVGLGLTHWYTDVHSQVTPINPASLRNPMTSLPQCLPPCKSSGCPPNRRAVAKQRPVHSARLLHARIRQQSSQSSSIRHPG